MCEKEPRHKSASAKATADKTGSKNREIERVSKGIALNF